MEDIHYYSMEIDDMIEHLERLKKMRKTDSKTGTRVYKLIIHPKFLEVAYTDEPGILHSD